MIIAHHLIWTAYGWWLPNDPRGSTSHRICRDIVTTLGDIHHGRKTVQPAGWEIREFYNIAPLVLKHDLLTFCPDERKIIAASFAETVTARKYTCYACAIMDDHIHILIRKHRDTAEQMIANLQKFSRDYPARINAARKRRVPMHVRDCPAAKLCDSAYIAYVRVRAWRRHAPFSGRASLDARRYMVLRCLASYGTAPSCVLRCYAVLRNDERGALPRRYS